MHQHIRLAGSSPGDGDWALIRGNPVLDRQQTKEARLVALGYDWQTPQACATALAEATGSFAVIVRSGPRLYAAVDRARSIPLFYSVRKDEIVLSDDARWVAEQVIGEKPEPESDDLSVTEFLLSGIITGSRTLSPAVRQLRAGELLFAEGSSPPSVHRYDRYHHTAFFAESEDQLHERLDQALLTSFDRLIQGCEGRCIALPLSGGLDSRLIALMLKRLGYDNVIAFTYGRPGNEESIISRRVAESLKFRWTFVPYSPDQWRQWFRSDERRAYYRMADGLSAQPLMMDWPAVGELRRTGAIPADSIFFPGLTADMFVGGVSRRLPHLYRPERQDLEVVVRDIINATFGLWDWSHRRDDLYPLLRERVVESLGDYNLFPDSASAYESWEASERHPKFFVNSVRAYEFWGYDWRIPFWESEFLDFWQRVPLEHRIGKRLYARHIASLYERLGGVDRSQATRIAHHNNLLAVRRRVRNTPLYPLLRKAYTLLRRRSEYDTHPMAWYGVMPRSVFLQMRGGWSSLHSFLAAERLGRLSFDTAERVAPQI